MTYIITVCVVLTPAILKRKLSEIKLQSRILFIGIIMLLVVLYVMPKSEQAQIQQERTGDFTERIVDCINITLTSYGFIINLFPISKQLKVYNNTNIMKSVLMALIFCFGAYITLTVFAINLYGENNIKESIFDNMQQDE